MYFIWQAKQEAEVRAELERLSSTETSTKNKNPTSLVINHTQVTQSITKTTSMITTTEKTSTTNNRNRLIISLSVSFLMVMFCICCSYYIFVHLIHYLNTTLDIKRDTSKLNRSSVASSAYSDDSQLCKIEDKTNEQRRSSTDSVELFRY